MEDYGGGWFEQRGIHEVTAMAATATATTITTNNNTKTKTKTNTDTDNNGGAEAGVVVDATGDVGGDCGAGGGGGGGGGGSGGGDGGTEGGVRLLPGCLDGLTLALVDGDGKGKRYSPTRDAASGELLPANLNALVRRWPTQKGEVIEGDQLLCIG